MEYAIHVTAIMELPTEPRSLCAAHWQELLPRAPLSAIYFGSEFCEELLPEVAEVERLYLWARQVGVEAVLLTPLVTPKGVAHIDKLLRALVARGCEPAVVCNDWGVLNLLLHRYPALSRRAGRLMNRGLRDPRLTGREAAPGETFPQTSRGLRSLLLKSGVVAVETDPALDGSYLGEKIAGLQRVLHFPYVFVASGRNCLVKADAEASVDDCFTKGLGTSCSGLCRGRWHQVERADCTLPLWRCGNTVFSQASPQLAAAHLARADRIVIYERPTA